jgi:hypothetical protein|tara:strand:+ start:256 stop:426 length:171 start_codon:yes stop_codon:yes gene_type:complete
LPNKKDKSSSPLGGRKIKSVKKVEKGRRVILRKRATPPTIEESIWDTFIDRDNQRL